MTARPASIAAALVALSACAALSACDSGDSGSAAGEPALDRRPQGRELPPAQQRRAFEAQQAITVYCGLFDESLKGGDVGPTRRQADRAVAAANRLAALARQRPYDLVQTGVDVRLYVGDLIEDLGNVECGSRLPRILESALG